MASASPCRAWSARHICEGQTSIRLGKSWQKPVRQGGAWPNRACSGHGYAVGEPWGWSGKVGLPAVVVGRLRRAADAIVRPIYTIHG